MSGLEVVGGAGGLAVQYDELSRASAALREEAHGLLLLVATRSRLLTDADLLASAVLHPAGFGRTELALLSALTGPHGVAAAAGALELRAAQLLLAVARYSAADAAAAELQDARRWLLGAAAVVAVPVAAGAGTGWAAGVVAAGGDPLRELERALTEHPGVVDDAAGAVGGLTAPLRSGLLGPLPLVADQLFLAATGSALLPRDLEGAAALLALLYEEGTPRLRTRADGTGPAVLVPGGVGDLLERLDHRNAAASVAAGTQGDIGLTRIVTTAADGQEQISWVLDLPGTKDWQVRPGERPAVNDLASNLELMAGTDNARVAAVEQILRNAQVGAHEPVLLVGHSQGGMVAMRAAQELAGRFAVTHVVTAGSPVGGMAPPAGVQVLSLENRYDIVPRADGRDNADAAGHVTVLFEHQTGTVAGNHGTLTAYLPAARALDLSADVSVRQWLAGAGAFLAERDERTTATTTVYTVTNGEEGP